MISSKNRFHGHGSLKYVYSKGQMVRGSFLSLRYAPNSRRSTYRLAVVVSKKVSKSAVVRNRIRRRLYEAVRTKEDKIKSPQDMILTVFSDQLANMPAKELDERLKRQMKKAGII